jgi:hypothetical protein
MERMIWVPIRDIKEIKESDEIFYSEDGGLSGISYGVLAVIGNEITLTPTIKIAQDGILDPADQEWTIFDMADNSVRSLFYRKEYLPESSAFRDSGMASLKKSKDDLDREDPPH